MGEFSRIEVAVSKGINTKILTGGNVRAFFIVEDVKTELQARNRHTELSYS